MSKDFEGFETSPVSSTTEQTKADALAKQLKDADKWPSWRYGPKGQAEVFASEADVPKGWKDTPPKPKADDEDL